MFDLQVNPRHMNGHGWNTNTLLWGEISTCRREIDQYSGVPEGGPSALEILKQTVQFILE